MLDLRLVRENPDRVREGMRRKGVDTAPLDALLEVDRVWREVLQEVEALRAERNRLSEAVGRRRRERGVAPVDGSEGGTGLADSADSDRGAGTAVRELGERLKRLEAELREREEERRRLLLEIPNLPFDDVPVGRDEHDNVEVRRWGRPRETTFAVEPHWDV
ncbi:MAG: hypothetical protein IRY95_09875, partial [Clostridia bacterium]|nr:hypothetical protein [Clostridia bacterium]